MQFSTTVLFAFMASAHPINVSPQEASSETARFTPDAREAAALHSRDTPKVELDPKTLTYLHGTPEDPIYEWEGPLYAYVFVDPWDMEDLEKDDEIVFRGFVDEEGTGVVSAGVVDKDGKVSRLHADIMSYQEYMARLESEDEKKICISSVDTQI